MTREMNDGADIASPVAERAAQLPSGQREVSAGIRLRSCRSSAPLSFAQQRMWFFNQLEPESPLYNLAVATRWTGPLDAAALERSLAEVVRRHEVLRTRFPMTEHGVVQEIAPAGPLHLQVLDFTVGSSEEREEGARRWMLAEAARPFRLTQESPFRAFALRLAPEEHLLLQVIHHIAWDRWSKGVLLAELVALYPALAAGLPAPLSELRIQYGDYAEWQQHHFQGHRLEHELAYWRGRLSGAPTVAGLPADRARPAAQRHVGAKVSFPLSEDLLEALTSLARREKASAFMVLLAGFKALWARSTGQADLVVGVPIAGRVRVEVEKLIGCFANTLVLRTDLSGDPTFREVLNRVREVVLGGFDHQEMPFEKLVEELRPPRNPGYHPFFQVLFTSHLDFFEKAVEIPGLRIQDVKIDFGTAFVDLSVDFKRGSAGRLCCFTYNTDLFDESTIAHLARQYGAILEAAVSDPERRLSAFVDQITDEEIKTPAGRQLAPAQPVRLRT
jgi:hypothetical protein